CNYPLNLWFKTGVDNVLGPVYISLYALIRVIFRNWHRLHGSCVDNVVDAFKSTDQSFPISYISYKKTNLRVFIRRILLGHLKLFLFVSRKNYQPLYMRILSKDMFC